MVDDTVFMARAIRLARFGRYTAMPNPCVGAVVVKDGKVVGEGWHRRAGEPHAEVLALRQAGASAQGATIYVTLEPCSHFGRTPPCAQALINVGVGRVVYAMVDPDPQVAGQGLAALQEAGIAVEGPLLEAEAKALNLGFIKRHQTGIPWVTLKLAMSLDGRTAMASGESQWITGPDARADVQRLRAQSCAIVTGSGTIRYDNPSLTVRSGALGLAADEQVSAEEVAQRQPLRVVVAGKENLPETARVFNDVNTAWTLLASVEGRKIRDVESVTLPGRGGRVNLRALLQMLADRSCNRVLVEAGAELSGDFMAAGLVDEVIVYMAPSLLGSEARPLMTLPFKTMREQCRLEIQDVRAVGCDWRFTLVPVRK